MNPYGSPKAYANDDCGDEWRWIAAELCAFAGILAIVMGCMLLFGGFYFLNPAMSATGVVMQLIAIVCGVAGWIVLK